MSNALLTLFRKKMVEMIRIFPLMSKFIKPANMTASNSKAVIMERVSTVDNIESTVSSQRLYSLTGNFFHT